MRRRGGQQRWRQLAGGLEVNSPNLYRAIGSLGLRDNGRYMFDRQARGLVANHLDGLGRKNLGGMVFDLWTDLDVEQNKCDVVADVEVGNARPGVKAGRFPT